MLPAMSFPPNTARITTRIYLEKDGRVLLVEEEINSDESLYNLPGGHVDAGEMPIEAAKREMKEETGLDVRITHVIGIVFAGWVDGHQSVRIVLNGDKVKGTLKVEKGSRLHWLTPEEIRALDPDRLKSDILAMIERGLKGERINEAALLFLDATRRPLSYDA